ncbi:MAG: NAD kinase [Hyphomicrobiales bacterium]
MTITFHFVASQADDAQQALQECLDLYGQCDAESADVIVALGGDGMMLQAVNSVLNKNKPIYGMNKGTIGFLMNEYSAEDLPKRVEQAVSTRIYPLSMTTVDVEGDISHALALNEVSLFRQSYQAAKLRISIDGKVRLPELICDGILCATPQGSTAYNFSAQGPIIPIRAPLLALTPISPFRPRRWNGALLPNQSHVKIEVLEHEKRPVNAVADHSEVKSVAEVRIHEDQSQSAVIMFDASHSWEDRILDEQFRNSG